jgi:hypothetical protein
MTIKKEALVNGLALLAALKMKDMPDQSPKAYKFFREMVKSSTIFKPVAKL